MDLDQFKNWISQAESLYVADSKPESMDNTSDVGFDLHDSRVNAPDMDSLTVTHKAPASSDDDSGPPHDETDTHYLLHLEL